MSVDNSLALASKSLCSPRQPQNLWQSSCLSLPGGRMTGSYHGLSELDAVFVKELWYWVCMNGFLFWGQERGKRYSSVPSSIPLGLPFVKEPFVSSW